MSPRVRRTVTLSLWKCARCAHEWRPRSRRKPTQCPGCKARNWEKPARPYRRRSASRKK